MMAKLVGKSILIADDDPDGAELLAMILRLEGATMVRDFRLERHATGRKRLRRVPLTPCPLGRLWTAYTPSAISSLQQQVTALQAPPKVLAQASSTNEVSALSADLVYQSVSLTLTPGTWMVSGAGSVYTLQNVDGVQLGLYNVTAAADVPNARGPIGETHCTESSTDSCLIGLTISSVIAVASNTVIRLHAYRNGTSQVGLGGNSGLVLPAANSLMAIQLP
jgi:hypothetical protein